MNTTPPKHELSKKLSEAYEALLANALQKAQQSGAVLHHIIDEVRDDISALNTFSQDEAALLREYVKRDLTDAANYIDSTGKELKDWLGFDLTLIETGLWNKFSAAADKTALELLQIQQQALNIGYSTGELAGIGTLLCDQCATPIHFHKPGHIPPCPKCHHTHFHRQLF
ncbi:MAG TPA: zinc ribbon-containing protein [Methylophilaceae bacterium]|jgi:hypothetical protein